MEEDERGMKGKNERKEILQQEEKVAFEKKTSKTAGAEKKRKEKTNAQRKKKDIPVELRRRHLAVK